MTKTEEKSFINRAEDVLASRGEPMDLYQLFEKVLEGATVDADAINDVLSAFYADLTTSAKFMYMGDNTWDLKRHQKIELWEKDGSFYNEYKDVHDDVLDARIAAQLERDKAHHAMLEKRSQAEAEAEANRLAEAESKASETAPAVEADIPDIEEDILDDPVFEDAQAPEEVPEIPEEPALDEEYDEFDEDEYNEYMDTYEDKYDE